MKISCLTLERYGGFSDRKLVFHPDATLHLILGANESGKTTALSAIGDLLFGFGHQARYDFKHDVKTLRVGAEVKLSDGSEVPFRRRRGNKNTIVDNNDQPLPEDLLSRIIGEVTRETFSKEFGLTAQALRNGGEELLKIGGKLSETLAASSAGLSALSRLSETLRYEAAELFTPRKVAGKAFYISVERYEQAEHKLRAANVTAEALQVAEIAIDAAEKHVEELKDKHGKTGRELARLQRCLRTRNTLAQLEAIAQDLEAFNDLVKIAPDVVERWQNLQNEYLQTDSKLRELERLDAKDTTAIALLAVNEAILECGPSIDALRERLGEIRKATDDLPRRQEAQRHATIELDELARKLGLQSCAALIEQRPSDLALAKVRALVEDGKKAADRLSQANEYDKKAQQDFEQIATQEVNSGPVIDPTELKQKLDSLAEVVTDADRLQREISESEVEDRSLSEIVLTLNPPVKSYELLSTLPFPDETEIETFNRAFQQLTDEERTTKINLAAAEHSIEEATTEIMRLTRDGISATKADLGKERVIRDDGLENLRGALGGDAVTQNKFFDVVLKATSVVDEVTDQLLNDIERATRKQSAENNLIDSQNKGKSSTLRLAEHSKLRVELESRWVAIWSKIGIIPRSPIEMTRWMQRILSILERRNKLIARRSSINLLNTRINGYHAAIVKLMCDYGRILDINSAADVLYREASNWMNELQNVWTKAKAHEASRLVAERAAIDAKKAVAQAVALNEAKKSIWPQAAEEIKLPSTASIAEADSAVAIWQSVAAPIQRFEHATRQVVSIKSDIAKFKFDVAELATRAMHGESVEDAVVILNKFLLTLGEARSGAEKRKHLLEAKTERHLERVSINAIRSELSEALTAVCSQLNLPDLTSLEATLNRLSKYIELEKEHADRKRTLTESSDGLDENALRAEQKDVDIDLLPSEAKRLELQQTELLNLISEGSGKLSQTRQNLNALSLGRDAIGAARDRAEALSELSLISERWIVRAAAANLAKLAIERHRATVEDPLIVRAGTLFSLATGGAFKGIAADYDEADQPIMVTVRDNDERVMVSGLSEGTRDQLFLALRLALLELRTTEPLPFIADDLLASFDDERTKCCLKLLSNFGQHCQVIVFTHHVHIAELARATVEQVNIIQL